MSVATKIIEPDAVRLVRNRSARSVARPDLIVLHITVSHPRPGRGDINAIINYFDQTRTQASAHIVNDSEGLDAQMVPFWQKAWTQMDYNSRSLSIEMIHYSPYTTREEWFRDAPRQLANTARWIARWSVEWDIPIRRAVTQNGGVQRSGVATHKQLGPQGGGHIDPGDGFPLPYVLKLARYFKLKAVAPRSRQFRAARYSVNRVRKHWGLSALR